MRYCGIWGYCATQKMAFRDCGQPLSFARVKCMAGTPAGNESPKMQLNATKVALAALTFVPSTGLDARLFVPVLLG